jgi:hypothetical protein
MASPRSGKSTLQRRPRPSPSGSFEHHLAGAGADRRAGVTSVRLGSADCTRHRSGTVHWWCTSPSTARAGSQSRCSCAGRATGGNVGRVDRAAWHEGSPPRSSREGLGWETDVPTRHELDSLSAGVTHDDPADSSLRVDTAHPCRYRRVSRSGSLQAPAVAAAIADVDGDRPDRDREVVIRKPPPLSGGREGPQRPSRPPSDDADDLASPPAPPRWIARDVCAGEHARAAVPSSGRCCSREDVGAVS